MFQDVRRNTDPQLRRYSNA